MLTEKNDVKKEDTDANANNEASAPNKVHCYTFFLNKLMVYQIIVM